MSLTPCKFYDIRSGKDVLIGDIDDAKQWLLDNVEVWESVAEKPTTPKPRKPAGPKTYDEVISTLQEGAGLTDEEVADYLPTYLQQQANLTRKTKTIKSAYHILMTQDPDSLIVDENTGEGDMSKKIAAWVQKEQSEKGWLDKQLDATDAIIDDFRSSATLGPALYFYQAYRAILLAAKAAGEKITASIARQRAIDQVVSEGKYTRKEVEAALNLIEKKPTIKKHDTIVRAIEAALLEGTQGAAKLIKTGLKDLKADLSERQITSLLGRLGKIKKLSPASIDRFLRYAEKVVDNANYDLTERAANKLRNRVEGLSRNAKTPGGDKTIFAQFASLSLSDMTPKVLDDYIKWAEDIVAGKLKNRNELVDFINDQKEFQDAAQAERSLKYAEGRERNRREEFERLKREGELPDGVSTYEEYISTLTKTKEAPDRLAKVKEHLENIEHPDTATEKEKKVLSQLKSTDLSKLNADELDLLDNALTAYEDGSRLFAVGNLLNKAIALNRIPENAKFRWNVDLKDVKNLSATHIFTKFARTIAEEAKFRAAAIQYWFGSSAKAYIEFEKDRKAILKMARDLGIQQQQWGNINVYAFMNESLDNPEKFAAYKKQLLSDLEQLQKRDDKNKKEKDSSDSAKLIALHRTTLEKAIETTGLASAETMADIKLSKGEKQMYEAARAMLDKYGPDVIDQLALLGNKDVELIPNYWGRKVEKGEDAEKLPETLDDMGFGDITDRKIGKEMFGRLKGRTGLTGKNGYYNPMGNINFFNALHDAVMVKYAMDAYVQAQAVFNDKRGFDRLVPNSLGKEDLRKLFIGYINQTKRYGSINTDLRKTTEKLSSYFVEAVTTGLLGNVSQITKQASAILYPISVEPQATTRAIGMLTKIIAEKAMQKITGKEGPMTQAYNELIKNSTLAYRLTLPDIIADNKFYAADLPIWVGRTREGLSALNTAAGGKGPIYGDKITSAVATIAGYLAHRVKQGAAPDVWSVPFEKEAAEGLDLDAIAAGEQMQGKTNNENVRLFFSQRQRDSKGRYFLMNFTYQAIKNVQIQALKLAKANTKEEAAEAAANLLAYGAMTFAFQAVARTQGQWLSDLFSDIMGMAEGEDEEEKKRRRARMKAYDEAKSMSKTHGAIIQEAINMGTATQGVLAQAAANFVMYAAMKAGKAYLKEHPELAKDNPTLEAMTKKEYNPIYGPGVSGLPGASGEFLSKPFDALLENDPYLTKAVLLQMGLTMSGQSGMAWLASQGISGARKAEAAEKLEERGAKESIEALFQPGKKEFESAKKRIVEQFKEGNYEPAKEAFQNIKDDRKRRIAAFDIAEGLYSKIDPISGFTWNEQKKLMRFLINNETTDSRGRPVTIRANGKNYPVDDLPNINYQYLKDKFKKMLEEEPKIIEGLRELDKIYKMPKGGRTFAERYRPIKQIIAE